ATDTTPAPTGPHDSPPEDTGQNNNHHHHIDFDAITPKNITNANIPATFSSSEETCSSTPSSEDIPHHCRHDIYHDLRNQARDMFILLHDLRSYARLNFTGFSKILKKFDKVTGLRLKDTYMENQVLPAYPFSTNTRKQLVKRVEAVTRTYARASGESNIEAVFNELKGCLRQQIVWDRNTIWRDMINLERRAGALEVQEAPVETGSGLPFKAVRPFSTRVKTLLYFTACTSAFL
ncbi:low-affinity phosphate transporter, partial [Spiromyces aspiralis]